MFEFFCLRGASNHSVLQRKNKCNTNCDDCRLDAVEIWNDEGFFPARRSELEILFSHKSETVLPPLERKKMDWNCEKIPPTL